MTSDFWQETCFVGASADSRRWRQRVEGQFTLHEVPLRGCRIHDETHAYVRPSFRRDVPFTSYFRYIRVVLRGRVARTGTSCKISNTAGGLCVASCGWWVSCSHVRALMCLVLHFNSEVWFRAPNARNPLPCAVRCCCARLRLSSIDCFYVGRWDNWLNNLTLLCACVFTRCCLRTRLFARFERAAASSLLNTYMCIRIIAIQTKLWSEMGVCNLRFDPRCGRCISDQVWDMRI